VVSDVSLGPAHGVVLLKPAPKHLGPRQVEVPPPDNAAGRIQADQIEEIVDGSPLNREGPIRIRFASIKAWVAQKLGVQAPVMQTYGDSRATRRIADAMPFAASVDQRQLATLDDPS